MERRSMSELEAEMSEHSTPNSAHTNPNRDRRVPDKEEEEVELGELPPLHLSAFMSRGQDFVQKLVRKAKQNQRREITS